MGRKPKHTSKLYAYLEKTGVISSGSDEAIAAAKSEFRRRYKAEWRKRNREKNKELAVILNPSELEIITAAAKKHKRSRPRFLKEAAIAYTKQTFVVLDILAVNAIREQLELAYNEIQAAFDENRLPYEIGKELLRRMDALEADILQQLTQPQIVKP